MPAPDGACVIQATRLNAYFHDALLGAARQRNVEADDATYQYLTLLLCRFVRSERVFDYDQERWQLRPLALLYGEALEARSERERRLWLQRLGDLALFAGGLFAGRLSRRFQDIDYCVAMGGNAYGYLSDAAGGPRERAVAGVFGELALNFGCFVDLVAVVTGRPGPDAPGDERSLPVPPKGRYRA